MVAENKPLYEICPYCRNTVDSLEKHYPRCLMRDALITGDVVTIKTMTGFINRDLEQRARERGG